MRNEDLLHEANNNDLSIRFPELSKKEIEIVATEKAKNLINEGELNEFQALASVTRLETFCSAFKKELRNTMPEIPEKEYKAYGVSFSTMNTGDRLDYESDEVYKELNDKLKARQELLKLAYKSKDSIFDSEGVEVPKVGIKTFGSEVIKLKF